MEGLKQSGKLQKWGKAADDLNRRNVMMGELRMVSFTQYRSTLAPHC